jgi:hypothetical protein
VGQLETIIKTNNMRVTLPTLTITFFDDRVVALKLVPDADVKDPSDDLMFIGPDCEDWKEGPNWLDANGKEVDECRWIRKSDTGWVHYFNDKWSSKTRRNVFITYVMHYLYNETIVLPNGQSYAFEGDENDDAAMEAFWKRVKDDLYACFKRKKE